MRVPLFKERPSLRPPTSPRGRVLVIFAPTEADVRPIRALSRRLRRLGIALMAATECHGEVRGEHDEAFIPNLLLVDAATQPWDAVVVAGGAGAGRVAEDQLAREVVQHAAERGKPVAALGRGRTVLARAGASGFITDDAGALGSWLRDQLGLGSWALDRRFVVPRLRFH